MFGLSFFVPVLVGEAALHEARETVSFNYGYEIEVEISSVLGRRFAVQDKRSYQPDLLFHQIHGRRHIDRAAVLFFDRLGDQGNSFSRGYPRVRKQVLEHANGIAHNQTLRTRNRTDGSVLRQPVRCGDDLPLIESEKAVVGKGEAWDFEASGCRKLERPLRQQAVQCAVDVGMFDKVAARIHLEHSFHNSVLV